MASIAAWIATARPDVLVVDVSVEVALLGRLLGVPTVIVAQRGLRTDGPHRRAYDAASGIVAPWSAGSHLPGEGPPDERLTFTGAVSRFDGRPRPAPASAGGDVLALVGSGGHALAAEDVRAAASATPDRRWHVAGALRVAGHPRVVDHGDRADVWDLLGRCSVVVGSAGGNVVAEVAAARKAFVCVPQARPFAEQERQAEALRRLGAAEVVAETPPAADWPDLLASAERRPASAWDRLHDGHGARRMAAAIGAVAAERTRPSRGALCA
jgi:UDP-N-acetylglucosamine:LPS N-acetylglucosamine transferase